MGVGDSPVKPLSGQLGRCLGAFSSKGSRCSVLAGTRLGSHGPEQKRLTEGSKLAWISKTAAGETGQISRQIPGTLLMGMLSGEAGWGGRVKHPGPHNKNDADRSNSSY